MEDTRWALAERERTGGRAIELLEGRLGVDRTEFLRRLGETLHLMPLALGEMQDLKPAFDLVPFPQASRRVCVALRDAEGRILVALGDPHDATIYDWLEESIALPFEYRLAHPLEVAAYLSQQEEDLRASDGVLLSVTNESASSDATQELSIEAISEAESPVVKLVDSTLYDALKAQASDIHLKTSATGLAIKYRVDGVLTLIRTVDGSELAEQVISRVKVLAELDIAERRVPQDGRFKVRTKGREIDIRVSVMPSVLGEDAVLRILDKRALSDELRGLTLEQLGFVPAIIKTLRRLASEPYGMLLVTGPTGSGKTTTLYAVISEVNKGLDNIVTIEDPVEYQLPGVLQIPVNEKKGLTFARGLRSILRHDPDRIMVGEIRDPETAEIAVQSALTGHLVYTTVHANNVFDVIGRFMHMGVDAFNFVSALNAVMAQRLVRVLCTACTVEDVPSPQLLEESGIDVKSAVGYLFCRGRGCAHCRGTGYRGRKAIAELMVMNDELRQLIVDRAPARELKKAAYALGTRSLREAALDLLRQGETSLDEINRVTFVAP